MTIRPFIAALLVSLSLHAMAADAPGATPGTENMSSLLTISPIFSQLVAFNMPLIFHVANEETSAHSYIREAVLRGDTVDKWTQMITVTASQGVSARPDLTPEIFAGHLAAQFRQTCPDTVTAAGLGSLKVAGYPATLLFVGCGTVGEPGERHSERAVVMVIKGENDYYTLQWAERAAAQSSPVAFDEQRWLGRLKQLMPVRLCAKVPGEQAPYASCLQRHPGS